MNKGKPDVKNVLELIRLKNEATSLYNKIDTIVQEMTDEFGAKRFYYDLEEFLDEYNPDNGYYFDESLMKDGRYLKLEITNNIQAMKEGKEIWKSVSLKPLSFKTQSLKRCPDSLK